MEIVTAISNIKIIAKKPPYYLHCNGNVPLICLIAKKNVIEFFLPCTIKMVDLSPYNNMPMLQQIILKLPYPLKHMVLHSKSQHSIPKIWLVSLASICQHIVLPDQLPVYIIDSSIASILQRRLVGTGINQ